MLWLFLYNSEHKWSNLLAVHTAIRLRYITDMFDVIKNWNAFYRWLRIRMRMRSSEWVSMREKNGAKERQNDTHQHEHEHEHKRNCKGKHFGFDPCIVCIHFLCTSIESCEQRFTSSTIECTLFLISIVRFFLCSVFVLYTFLVFTAITRYLNDTINYFAEIDV